MNEIEKIKNDIVAFYKAKKIDIDVVNVVESYAVTSYYAKIDTTKTDLKKVEKALDDLALYTGAKNITLKTDFESKRIVFEIPNKNRKTLKYDELIKNQKKQKGGLFLNIGATTGNDFLNVNLCKTPHLLIAGTTGAGKSVLVNTILLNLLENYTPEELQVLLIDAKQVELTPFENIPHLHNYIVKNLHDTKAELRCVLATIQARYSIMKNSNNKNIETYNATHSNKFPYIVIIIDELADLILQDKKEKTLFNESLEDLICRIAQIGRASGIHLIVSTQRPSVDIITGLIKANIPSRIALNVASATDSRVILDSKGAERLTGNGDFLFKLIGNADLIRLQGAYIDEQEQEQRIDAIIEKHRDYIIKKEQERTKELEQMKKRFEQEQKQKQTNVLTDEEKEERKAKRFAIYKLIIDLLLSPLGLILLALILFVLGFFKFAVPIINK